MSVQKSISSSPFDLANHAAYESWRDQKLSNYPVTSKELIVKIQDVTSLTAAETKAFNRCYQRANLAIYQLSEQDLKQYSGKEIVRHVGEHFSIRTLDKNIRADDGGISALSDVRDNNHHEYIPYSNRPISWHTDGYYNTLDRLIRAMVLHCDSPAVNGGENAFVDHEIVYIQLRDENPELVRCLMQDNVMTIPENVENGELIRSAQSGPVFSFDPLSDDLHMRYTARVRSIEWQDDRYVKQAVEFIKSFLFSDSTYILRHRLAAGQGIICNNVLHNRSAFEDDKNTGQERLIYRGRFYERISPGKLHAR